MRRRTERIGTGNAGESFDGMRVVREPALRDEPRLLPEHPKRHAERRGVGARFEKSQQAGEPRPGKRVVHRAERVGNQRRIVEEDDGAGGRIHNRDRLNLKPRRERREPPGRSSGEGTARTTGVAQAEELLERRLRAGVAPQPGRERHRRSFAGSARRPGDRVEDAVNDESADVVREQIGVRDAQIGGRASRCASPGRRPEASPPQPRSRPARIVVIERHLHLTAFERKTEVAVARAPRNRWDLRRGR